MIFRGCLVIGFLIAAFILFDTGLEMLPSWALVVMGLLLLVVGIAFGGQSREFGSMTVMIWVAVVMIYLVQSVVDLDQMGATSFEAVSKSDPKPWSSPLKVVLLEC